MEGDGTGCPVEIAKNQPDPQLTALPTNWFAVDMGEGREVTMISITLEDYKELLADRRKLNEIKSASIWELAAHLSRNCTGCSRRQRRLMSAISNLRVKLGRAG